MKVLIGVPGYQPGGVGTSALLRTAANKQQFAYEEKIGSLLTWNHNRLLADALNLHTEEGFTHLMIMHSDVNPEREDWFKVFCEEMEKCGGDVLSATIPIKDNVGDSSTALDIGPDKWHPVRLSQKTISELPSTFTTDKLLLNTGLMMIDLNCVGLGDRLLFHIDDLIEKDEQGKWVARVASEDWEFSRQARAMGARLYATSAVPLFHHGSAMWGNRQVWGPEKPETVNKEVIFSSADGEMRVLKF